MTSEIVAMPLMKVVERTYFTPPHYRLATFAEATQNLEVIKQQGLLHEWETARLLDGWISGPRYNFQMGDDFRRCMGHMLLIQIQSPPNHDISGDLDPDRRSIYADVMLNQKEKEVALFLCVQDWNYEVVYWVINSWENSETYMNPLDVRDGNIPFSNRTTFQEMNKMMCLLGRTLGDEGHASQKARNRKLSAESIEEVLRSMGECCWNKLNEQYKQFLGNSFLNKIDREATDRGAAVYLELDWLQDFASQTDTADTIWNFSWYDFSNYIIADYAVESLVLVINKWANDKSEPVTTNQRLFVFSTSILYYLSIYERRLFDVNELMWQARNDDPQSFEEKLQNPNSKYYDQTGNYDVLNKILIFAVEEGNSFVVNKVLEWGAQSVASLHPGEQNTAVYYAITSNRKDILKSLFDKCPSKEQLANATNEEGKTALHLACSRAAVSMCELVLNYGGKSDVQDNYGRLPLHYAVQLQKEEVVDMLIGRGNSDTMQSQDVSKLNQMITDMVNRKDKNGESPLDIAIRRNDIKLMGKLLSVSGQSVETYFDKMDSGKLLREFAFEGNLEIVEKLLESGADLHDCDEEGRTALHYMAMSQHDGKACKIAESFLRKCRGEEEQKKLIAKQDKEGKTAVHVAAIKGHHRLLKKLLYPDIMNADIIILESILEMKDADGRNLIYDAVKGDHDNIIVIDTFFMPIGIYNGSKGWSVMEGQWWRIPDVDSMIDRTGLTVLHVAASEGKIRIVNHLLRRSKDPKAYVMIADFLGQTALHKAAKGLHIHTITVLLHWGAQPLLERDCDGRTALHYAAQNNTEEKGIAVAELLLKKCASDEQKLLFLWASAAGLGTADQNLCDSPLKRFLLDKKKEINAGKENNLLRTAASLGDIEMTKELLTRGTKIEDIQDQHWKNSLSLKKKHNAETVCNQIQSIAEQGNDQPAASDNLGRTDFAYGLAALLLNPYLKPPITVGISGSWGMGKSSLMIQTEGILLKTAAQLALLPDLKSPKSSLPGVQSLELSQKGKKKYQEIRTKVDLLENEPKIKKIFFRIAMDKITNWWKIFLTMLDKISNCCKKRETEKSDTNTKEGDSLCKFLNQYDAKYHHIFKSLAAMDSSDMFMPKGQESHSRPDPAAEGSVPAILTVRYNAWKYRNESEALAGMAVEITKEMEGVMTAAQWLSTCLRNTWRKQKQSIWIEVMFPCLLAVLLAASFTWIVWMLLDRYKIKDSLELKYASLPVTVVIIVWTLVKKVMSTVNPVSTQLMNYVKFPDHTEKLGYQERVISDITFLKEEIGSKPFWVCTAAAHICRTWSYIISLLSFNCLRETMANPTPSSNLRTIVFVDDLDRCQESVILQVLSAINLVLAVCEISVVLGMDKALIERAIMKKYGDKSLKNSKHLADKYLQKIIQLPLDLPDPSEVQSKSFLERHLGVFTKQSKKDHPESEADAEDDSIPEIEAAYHALFSPFDQAYIAISDLAQKMFDPETPIPEASSTETEEAPTETETAEAVTIDVQPPNGTNASGSLQISNTEGTLQTDATEGYKSLSDFIPITEMLFIRYSKGEREVFFHFQKMATDFRKLPREWKRLLTYHRLVWNIFFINNEAGHLDGWQVQLITWIFICWEWEENINTLIQNWNRIGVPNTYNPYSKTKDPSLREIVEHCIKNESWIMPNNKGENLRGLSNESDTAKLSKDSENKAPRPEKREEEVKLEITSRSVDVSESSNRGQVALEEVANDQITSMDVQGDISKATDFPESREAERLENLSEVVKEEEKFEKTLLNVINSLKKEIKEEMKEQVDALKKEMKEQVDALRKEIKEEMKQQGDALKKDVKELKDQVDSQQAWKWEKRYEEKKLKSRSWRRLKFALQKYDVSMDAIQAFQRFRFYCVAGHLPWPLPEQ